MRYARALAVVGTVVLCQLVSAGAALGQPQFERLYDFRTSIAGPVSGRLAEGTDGSLYAAASSFDTANVGIIFKFTRQADGTLTPAVLHTFTGTDGRRPNGVLYASDGMLYGTTCQGGAGDQGTVFRLSPEGAFATLHEFGPESSCPSGLVEAADGNLYGTTSNWRVFRLSKGGAFEQLAPYPLVFGPLVAAPDGFLYGIGTGGLDGTVFFRMDSGGSATPLHVFPLGDDIAAPRNLVLGVDGNFYGTSSPGSNQPTRVFRLTPGGVPTVLATFTQPGLNATVEQGADGLLYGALRAEGLLRTTGETGILFRLAPGGPVSLLYSFRYVNGSEPLELTRVSGGEIYGSTAGGGINRRGVIFRIDAAAQVRVAYTFSDPNPLSPQGPMIVGPDGALYGTTCGGGLYNAGTVFRFPLGAPAPTVIHSFSYWDGYCPMGSLAVGADGALYGATSLYGLGFGGTLFRVTTSGAFAVLRFLSGGDGFSPHGGLIRASDGHFYGTTRGGGPYPATLFRLSNTGTFTTLRTNLDRGPFGYGAVAPLIQASDGNIYGTSGATVFRWTLSGAFTTFPVAGQVGAPLAEGPAGTLYGLSFTLTTDGPLGAVFRLTPSGVEPPLATFAGLALGGLLLGTDGYMYGTSYGSVENPGSIFRVSPEGALTTIHNFTIPDGIHPWGTLTLAADGAMYGSTMAGGRDSGTLFRLVPPSAAFVQRE